MWQTLLFIGLPALSVSSHPLKFEIDLYLLSLYLFIIRATVRCLRPVWRADAERAPCGALRCASSTPLRSFGSL